MDNDDRGYLRIKESAHLMGIDITEAMEAKMWAFFDYVLKRNETMNLTRITDREEAATKHFLDSLAPLSFNLIPEGVKLCDVGTGAGFPGLPLKIARPDIDMTLLDARRKRVDFLRETMDSMGISAHCVHSRAEDMPKSAFDIVTTRAVAALPKLIDWCLPMLKKGGKMIAYKTKQEAQECADLAKIYPVDIKNLDHVLMVVNQK